MHDMVEMAKAGEAGLWDITRDLAFQRHAIVNVFFYGTPGAGDRSWVLIDAGLPGSAGRIIRGAAERFGEHARPAAIVLTHGHFDHVGAVRELSERWNTPVYAHPLELPYITRRSPYPPPDPTVGGGAMARMSPLYPRGPFDGGDEVHALPSNGMLPHMPGWRWIHTPGHSPGHVSLFRDADRLLVAGDAFVTTKQESAIAVLSQRPEIHGPPKYYTTDWVAARRSVEALAALEPEIMATGHGRPLGGPAAREGLRELARGFQWEAVPMDGRYVREPAMSDEQGLLSVPPPVPDDFPKVMLGVAAVAAGVVAYRRRRRAVGLRPIRG